MPRIYWLNGVKVADNYSDFYDGTWDDETHPKNEHGSGTSVGRFWTGSNDNGTGATDGHPRQLGATNGQGAGGCDSVSSGALNASGGVLRNTFGCRTGSRPLVAVSQLFVVPNAAQSARATTISIISSPARGDTYGLGETIEFEMTFSEEVGVRGTPQLALVMRDASDDAASEFRAGYVRSSSATKLVFAHTVAAGDRAAGGIATGAGEPLQLNGATITATDGSSVVSALTASSYIQAEGSRSKVDGSLVPSVGVCNRTLQVRDAIVAAVSDATDCSQVTSAHLAAIEGTLTVQGLTSLNAGDFAGLSAVEILLLRRGAIETLPVGVFDELGSVRSLALDTGLTHLPRDIFRGLGDTLTRLGLLHNELAAGGLPDGIFEELTKLTSLQLIGNPGADTFTTTADAGPGGTVSAGQTVTLGGPGNAGGPWGSNVTYEWTQTDGSDDAVSTVTLSASDVTNPSFTVPVLSAQTDVKLVLRVAGVGAFTAQHGTSTAQFSIRALAPTGLAVVSEPIEGETYQRGETIEVAVNFSDRVVVAGTPQLALSVGVNTRNADYVRGTNSNQLVFEYTVVEADADTDGIVAGQNALALNGGAITSVYGAQAILTHTALAAQTGHKVDGSDEALTGGICERTPQMRDKLVDLVNANDSNVTNCSEVDPDNSNHLAALTGRLTLNNAGIAALKQGDFANLGGITVLHLGSNDLTALPAGVFEGLEDTLTTLTLNFNDLQTIPAGVFDQLTGLRNLFLDNNDLSSLPPRVFEKLTAHERVVSERQPRQRALRADRKGRAGGRVRRRLGWQRDPRGRWGGERLRRSLGRQRRV